MKNFRLFIFLTSFLFINFLIVDSYGQEVSANKIYSFLPQYMFHRGIRIDIERKLKENRWIQICPQIYFANGEYENSGDTYNELFGAGLAVYSKRYINNNILTGENDKIDELGIYISYGLSYNYFYLNYLENYSYGSSTPYSTCIHKIGGDVLIGYQVLYWDILSVDIYTGLGIRYSITKTEGMEDALFNNFYNGFGYTGNLMHLGLRIGISL